MVSDIESPPESLAAVRRRSQQAEASSGSASKSDAEVQPYQEPDIGGNNWPAEWSDLQRVNWREYGAPIYDELRTEVGRYWYRRCYRPKKAHDGMMRRDHVKTGTPERYIYAHVNALLQPGGSGEPHLKYVHNAAVRNSADVKGELLVAVEDIARAMAVQLDDDEIDELPAKTKELL